MPRCELPPLEAVDYLLVEPEAAPFLRHYAAQGQLPPRETLRWAGTGLHQLLLWREDTMSLVELLLLPNDRHAAPCCVVHDLAAHAPLEALVPATQGVVVAVGPQGRMHVLHLATAASFMQDPSLPDQLDPGLPGLRSLLALTPGLAVYQGRDGAIFLHDYRIPGRRPRRLQRSGHARPVGVAVDRHGLSVFVQDERAALDWACLDADHPGAVDLAWTLRRGGHTPPPLDAPLALAAVSTPRLSVDHALMLTWSPRVRRVFAFELRLGDSLTDDSLRVDVQFKHADMPPWLAHVDMAVIDPERRALVLAGHAHHEGGDCPVVLQVLFSAPRAAETRILHRGAPGTGCCRVVGTCPVVVAVAGCVPSSRARDSDPKDGPKVTDPPRPPGPPEAGERPQFPLEEPHVWWGRPAAGRRA